MKTIYAIDFLEDKFLTVEIPVMSEDDRQYYVCGVRSKGNRKGKGDTARKRRSCTKG